MTYSHIFIGCSLQLIRRIHRQSFEYLREAATSPYGLVQYRVQAAVAWYDTAADHSSALEAATLILDILAVAVHQSRSLKGQYERLQSIKYIKSIASDAAARYRDGRR